jgi:hypothetical protein
VATSKGLYHFGVSFGIRLLGSQRFVPSSQTFDPTVYGVKQGLFVTQESYALRCASWVVLLASNMVESHCSNEGTLVFLVGW